MYQRYCFRLLEKKNPIYVPKNIWNRHFDLSLPSEESRRPYAVIKDFNLFMRDHTVPRGGKRFCCYCLQTLSSGKILKSHAKVGLYSANVSRAALIKGLCCTRPHVFTLFGRPKKNFNWLEFFFQVVGEWWRQSK